MYKAVKKTKVIRIYMEALSLHTGSSTLHWEDNTSCISVVEDKIVTPRVKHIGIPVWFPQEIFDNGIFNPKCEKSSVIPADMCTKPCSGPIISWSAKAYMYIRTALVLLIALHMHIISPSVDSEANIKPSCCWHSRACFVYHMIFIQILVNLCSNTTVDDSFVVSITFSSTRADLIQDYLRSHNTFYLVPQ